MLDGFVRMRQGEVRPIYAQIIAQAGTLTIAPGGKVSIVDQSAAIVAGPADVTGYDPAALAAPRAWFTLDTSALPAGFYRLCFKLDALGSDGLPRTYEPVIGIRLEDAYVPPPAPSE